MTRFHVAAFRSRIARRALACLLLTVTAAAVSGCKLVTVRPLNESGMPSGPSSSQQPFNAVAYVDGIWSSKVLPTAQEKAVELSLLLPAVKTDPEAAGKQYGKREGSSPYNFLVKGRGKVLSVNTGSRVGLALVDLVPLDGQPDVSIQIGPVLRGNAVRDAVGFISFNEFVNQLQFADVANELNERVLKTVLNGIDPATLAGKMVTLHGAYTLDGDAVIITPLKLEVGGEG